VSASAGPPPDASAVQPAAPSARRRKPRLALFIATACGLGYIPKAPGTFGSLAGVLVSLAPWWWLNLPYSITWTRDHVSSDMFWPENFHERLLFLQVALTVLVGAIGAWAAHRAANFLAVKDPQKVIVDEVSGQQLTYLLGLMPLVSLTDIHNPDFLGFSALFAMKLLSWKYLLLGLILFRLFDIWKPFPVRQAESLPGGWGIMADDWVAAVYAGIGLWIARAVGL